MGTRWKWTLRAALALLWLTSLGATQAPSVARREFTREVAAVESRIELGQQREASPAAHIAWNRALQFTWQRDAQFHRLLFRLAYAAMAIHEFRIAHDALTEVVEFQEARLPENDLHLQRLRHNLAVAKLQLGQLRDALTLQERILRAFETVRPPDHADVQKVRVNLAMMKSALGDVQGAIVIEEQVVESMARTRRPDDEELAKARHNLAVSKNDLGDTRGALALEQQVLAAVAGTRSDDDPLVLEVRATIAMLLLGLGDLRAARQLATEVLEAQSRVLAPDHPQLQSSRLNLASVLRTQGDLPGALALQEVVVDVLTRTLPQDHPHSLAAMQNLAVTKGDMGDLAGALALEEQVVAARERLFLPDHPSLQEARSNLANTKRKLGDLQGALQLGESVCEVLTRTVSASHPSLLVALNNLAITKKRLGDLRGAQAIEERVLEVRTETLPPDHPERRESLGNLALTRRELGDLPGALALEREVLAIATRTLPEGHPGLQSARANLAMTFLDSGDIEEAVTLALQRSDATRRRLADWVVSPRGVAEWVQHEREAVEQLLDLAEVDGVRQSHLAREALVLSQLLRGAEMQAMRTMRRARALEPERADALEAELGAAVDEVGRIATSPLAGDEAALAERNRRLQAAVATKERLQRDLLAMAQKGGARARDLGAVTIRDLAAQLPKGAAAATILGHTAYAPDPQRPGRWLQNRRLVCMLLDGEARTTLLWLGERGPIDADVARLRQQAGGEATRGRDPARAEERDDAAAIQRRLRETVLDPILAAAGTIDTLYLSLDEALELVPLDALDSGKGGPVGSHIALRPVVSLLDLLDRTPIDPGDQPGLLLIGGLDYAEGASGAAGAAEFATLAGSRAEIEQLGRAYGDAFPGGAVTALTGRDATKAQLIASAPKATFVHVATHGYFAPEVEARADETQLALRVEQRVSSLSPLVLCGLALSGANRPVDSLGRRPGILNAEEVLGLDLSRCCLATLSACDTSLGVSRAGQGYASLRMALQGAGARFVLTSLWKVGDEATQRLMVDFYRRLWARPQEPHGALWAARMAARDAGAPFRDWAGWVLTGA